ncbi:Complement Clr-like EGF domain [Trinorchestia longiramus]|nr:Complement Clr-like EGF domain [Trinorchestia longiramus]
MVGRPFFSNCYVGFNFGVPNFNFSPRPTPGSNNAGRQEPGRPVNVGQVLGSILGGFLNPQSQNANNNVAGALAGLNNALSPNQLPGETSKRPKLSKLDAWLREGARLQKRMDFAARYNPAFNGTSFINSGNGHVNTTAGTRKYTNPFLVSPTHTEDRNSNGNPSNRVLRSSGDFSSLPVTTDYNTPNWIFTTSDCPSSWPCKCNINFSKRARKTGDYKTRPPRKLASTRGKPSKRSAVVESKMLIREIMGTLKSLGIKPDAIVGSIPRHDHDKNEDVLLFFNHTENEIAELQSTRDALSRLETSEANVGVTLATFFVSGLPVSLVAIDGKVILIVEITGNCDDNKGGCEQGCRQQGRFVRCFCNSGFVLNRDRKTCSDINECLFNNGGCRYMTFCFQNRLM